MAEQVLRGGIPAVRTALHLEREKAEAEGRPAPATDQLIAMAEDLLPRLKAAEWRDRAEAAAKTSEEISLRDLRSVVAGSDVARDEETRNLAATLREALDRRLETQRAHWSEEITKQLDEGRVVRALRLSSRPPEPAARLDDELSKRLADAAGEAMSPSASADLWLALLDAAVASPVRRTISPAGLPPDGPSEVRQAALQQSSRIPALAAMLGVSIPPPPVRKPPPEGRPQPARRPEGRPPRRPDARPRPARRPGEPPADESEPAAKAEPESQTPAAPTVAAEPEPTPVEAEPASVTDEEPVAAPPPSVAEPEPAPPPVEAEAAAAPEADTESTPASDSAPPPEDDEPSAPAGEDA